MYTYRLCMYCHVYILSGEAQQGHCQEAQRRNDGGRDGGHQRIQGFEQLVGAVGCGQSGEGAQGQRHILQTTKYIYIYIYIYIYVYISIVYIHLYIREHYW